MANVYRARIASVEAGANGTVNADCWVELRTGTTPNFVWVPAQAGHFTVVLQASDVLAAVNNPANDTNAKKRNAIEDLIKAQVVARGIDNADEAYLSIVQYLPKIATPEDPETITIRQ